MVFNPTDTNDYTSASSTVTLVVLPAALTVTATLESKTYGQTLTFGAGSTNFTSAGLQNSDTIGTVTLSVTGNGGASNAAVGLYTITPTNATGGTFSPSNYALTYNTGALTVSQAAPVIYLEHSCSHKLRHTVKLQSIERHRRRSSWQL